MSIVDKLGIMHVHDASIPSPAATDTLEIGPRLDYHGIQAPSFCFGAPVYANLTTTFSAIEGIGTHNFCTWVFTPTNRCLDFSPPSDDCANPLACD